MFLISQLPSHGLVKGLEFGDSDGPVAIGVVGVKVLFDASQAEDKRDGGHVFDLIRLIGLHRDSGRVFHQVVSQDNDILLETDLVVTVSVKIG